VYPHDVRLFRWQSIVHLCACAILMWTVVDLLVPQLCAAESTTVAGDASHEDQSPVRPDSDCFCCSHIVSPVSGDAVFAVVTTVGVSTFPAVNLPLGVSPLLYHPPLQA
jgi:hypothetical protein